MEKFPLWKILINRDIELTTFISHLSFVLKHFTISQTTGNLAAILGGLGQGLS